MGALFQHHLGLLQRRQLKLNGLISAGRHILLSLPNIGFQLADALFSGQNIFDQLVIIIYIGLKQILQLLIRSFDLCFILFQFHINFINLIAHRFIFI